MARIENNYNELILVVDADEVQNSNIYIDADVTSSLLELLQSAEGMLALYLLITPENVDNILTYRPRYNCIAITGDPTTQQPEAITFGIPDIEAVPIVVYLEHDVS